MRENLQDVLAHADIISSDKSHKTTSIIKSSLFKNYFEGFKIFIIIVSHQMYEKCKEKAVPSTISSVSCFIT